MKFKTLGRHAREGTKSVWRNGWMTISAVGAVTTTLLLVGVFLALMLNLNEIAGNIEDDVEVKVLVELTADEQQVSELENNLGDLPAVGELTYSSKEEELDELVDSLGDQGKAFELFEQSNPLNDAFIIKPDNPVDAIQIAEEAEAMDQVDEVDFGEEIVQRLFQFNEYARYIGLGLIVGLVFTAIFLISNTIKITIIARKKEIGIMKLVGATNAFIRWPFFVEGLTLGVLGSIIPIAAVMSGYYYLYYNLQDRIQFDFIQLLPFNPFAFQLAGLILVIGAFIGVWGSVMSVRKFLKV
ncbi:permease-like cell division protein FtsX [Halobacillus sp. A1]|uniref:permease-like cell division protein FtsX n=1 Tax=Halobacillus sp. A1 TaxID=2880262 RepID=UPI0020A6C34B|nr:permease-like cell division protein FtsX [Halobacillus sp. A1]MCP3031410.1 permease-like cell division protein FtsX [Halobacillus sp. A1]